MNIEDIAKEAGVSKTTVSRVLNDYRDVSEKTKQRVLEVMKLNNYRPSSIARSLATDKTYTIGLFGAPDSAPHNSSRVNLNDPFFREVIYGMEVSLGREGYDIMYFSEKPEKKFLGYKDILEDRHVDGVVFLGSMEKTPAVSEVVESDIPTVFVDSTITGRNTTSVYSDNYSGGKLGAEYLIDMGHKKIGYLMGKPEGFPSNMRLKGLKEILNKNNLRLRPEWSVVTSYTKQAGYQSMKKILNLKNKPTAIFCQDEIAIGAIKAIKDAGYQVPEDFSIVGFDDLEMCDFIFPSLTTVKQFKYQIGEEAAKALLKLINLNKDHYPSSIKLPVELIERNSCRKLN